MSPTPQSWSPGFIPPVNVRNRGMGVLPMLATTAISVGMKVLGDLLPGLLRPDTDKTQATAIVDRIEATVLRPNLATWQSLSEDEKTPAAQAQFLSVFDRAWNGVIQGCGQVELGTAGINCIGDRQRGSCKWRDSAGECWNWFIGYRDPIANDPAVAVNRTLDHQAGIDVGGGSYPDGTPVNGGGSVSGSGVAGTVLPNVNIALLAGLGLIGFAVVMAMGGDE